MIPHTAGELTFSVSLEENAGAITTNIEAVNEVVITLTQPTATTIESRRQGDPSFVTGTLNGTQVVLEVDVDSPMQPAALQIDEARCKTTTPSRAKQP